MDLFILRHGLAGQRGDPTPGGDSQRPLTTEGAEKMRRIARGMKVAGMTFDLILSSPYTRASQTAEIVANVFELEKKLEFTSVLAADGNPKELVDELKRSHHKKNSVLLVGHEPYLSRQVSLLISGSTSLPITLKKGGLCKLSVDALRYGRCATLEWLLTPRLMRRMR